MKQQDSIFEVKPGKEFADMGKRPRPEHPRPQLMRDSWESLNGIWEFAFDFSNSGIENGFPETEEAPLRIIVPFCPESPLSGIGYTDFIPAVWYRRSFQITPEKIRGCILLHFGAVDYECSVWINGKSAGTHKGGYTSFSFDISELVTEGENTVVVYAEDDIQSGKQCSGKQSAQRDPYGCYYTRTTGIWQSVWLEYLPHAYIKALRMTPDAFNGSIEIEAELVQGAGAELTLTILENGGITAQKKVCCTERLAACRFDLASPHLWSPSDPYLYDVKAVLRQGESVDTVYSYFGLRTVECHDHKFYLNGKPIFQRLVLDQGFYPDGIYTAPSDDALIQDIKLAKRLGFNGARLHEKVFEERYLYHADRLGYMVWGEYASWGLDITEAEGLEIFLPEWLEVVMRDYSHPSIIGWCPFNETDELPACAAGNAPDQEIVRTVYQVTKAVDPTRPVIDTSGYCHTATDIYDLHDYEQEPAVFQNRYGKLEAGGESYDEKGDRQRYDGSSPLLMSEFGGTFWSSDPSVMEELQPEGGWLKWEKPQSEKEVCRRIVGLSKVLLSGKAFCGFCYTQLTDVEQEFNGLYTYERNKKFSDAVYEEIRGTNLRIAAVEEGD